VDRQGPERGDQGGGCEDRNQVDGRPQIQVEVDQLVPASSDLPRAKPGLLPGLVGSDLGGIGNRRQDRPGALQGLTPGARQRGAGSRQLGVVVGPAVKTHPAQDPEVDQGHGQGASHPDQTLAPGPLRQQAQERHHQDPLLSTGGRRQTGQCKAPGAAPPGLVDGGHGQGDPQDDFLVVVQGQDRQGRITQVHDQPGDPPPRPAEGPPTQAEGRQSSQGHGCDLDPAEGQWFWRQVIEPPDDEDPG
jgi:hypothetical protein